MYIVLICLEYDNNMSNRTERTVNATLTRRKLNYNILLFNKIIMFNLIRYLMKYILHVYHVQFLYINNS